MQIIINLVHDTITYDETPMKGTLKSGLFGAEEFRIYEDTGGKFIEIISEIGTTFTYNTYPCELTDHDKRLVVNVELY